MKQKLAAPAILATGLALLLVGCASEQVENVKDVLTNYMEEQAIQDSGIQNDPDYQSYKDNVDNGEVDDNGYPKSANITEEMLTGKNDKQGAVRVTIATNDHLKIQYYLDETLTQQVVGNECYLDPNECLYSTEPQPVDTDTNLYSFDTFRVYEYDFDGNQGGIADFSGGSNGLVLQIPMQYEGEDLMVVPVGKYENRVLHLTDFCTDESGAQKTLKGDWIINGAKTTAETYEINPVEAYSVQYQFDPDEYFFVSSDPAKYGLVESAGMLTFPKAESTEDVTSYTVELQHYLKATITTNMDGTISRNGEPEEKIIKGKGFTLEKLKYGDTIVVRTKEQCKVTSNSDHVSGPEEASLTNGYSYTMEVTNEHRPHLKVILDDSVGKETSFSIIAETPLKDGLRPELDLFKNPDTVFDDQVATAEGITLSATGGVLAETEALEYTIQKDNGESDKAIEVCYTQTTPDTQNISALGKAADGEPAYYKNITVTVRRTAAYSYEPKTLDHTTIVLKKAGTQEAFSTGEVKAGDCKVELTITPDNGYYLTGNEVKNYMLQKTMTYKQYQEQIGKILREHPVKRFYAVTLQTEDPYGICSYTIDGKDSTGTVRVRDGQKIVLHYTIREPEKHSISYGTEGFAGFVDGFKSKTDISCEIPVNATLDGTTIKREDYVLVVNK